MKEWVYSIIIVLGMAGLLQLFAVVEDTNKWVSYIFQSVIAVIGVRFLFPWE